MTFLERLSPTVGPHFKQQQRNIQGGSDVIPESERQRWNPSARPVRPSGVVSSERVQRVHVCVCWRRGCVWVEMKGRSGRWGHMTQGCCYGTGGGCSRP